MNYTDLKIKSLENRHNITILLFLADNEPSIKTDIYSAISTNPRMPEKLNELDRAGLIIQKTDRFENNRTTVTLTDKGRLVAHFLKEIENELNTNHELIIDHIH